MVADEEQPLVVAEAVEVFAYHRTGPAGKATMTRTPNLLIRRRIRRVRLVLSPAVVAGRVVCVFRQLLANPAL